MIKAGFAALSGVGFALATPVTGSWPLGFACFAPLYLALHQATPRQAALLGFGCGGLLIALGTYWLPESIRRFADLPLASGALLWSVLCSLHGLQLSFCCWLTARSAQRDWPAWAVFPCALVACELVVPSAIPFSFALALDRSPLMQVADVGGRLALTFLLGWTNAAIGEAAKRLLARGHAVAPQPMIVAGLVLVSSSAYCEYRRSALKASIAAAPTLSVAVVQVGEGARQLGDKAGLAAHLELTRRTLKRFPVDLVIWGENTAGAPIRSADVSTALRYRTRSLGVSLLAGVPVRPDDSMSPTHNSILLTDPTGRVCADCRYDKQRLFPLGEYLPWAETLPWQRFGFNNPQIVRGNQAAPLPFGDHRIGGLVCFEATFPDLVRELTRDGRAELLVNVTNDSWFGATSERRLHLAFAKLRAVESARYLIRAASTGISGIISPTGEELAVAETDRAAVITESVAWLSGRTVYTVWGDYPWWLLVIVCAATGTLMRRPG